MMNAAISRTLDHPQLEDTLTAAVFIRLRDLPPEVLGEWLATARNHVDPAARSAPGTAAPVIELWPAAETLVRRYGSARPTVIVRFDNDAYVIATRSWTSNVQLDDDLEHLARQWAARIDRDRTRARVAALVHLTPHVTPPEDALAESEALGTRASSLWWLSWSTLVPILERQIATGERASQIAAADLLAYLERVGLLGFHGWRMASHWQSNPCWTYRHTPVSPYGNKYAINRPAWRYSR
jgi:hypothetical protein